jgi:hypothetical protein
MVRANPRVRVYRRQSGVPGFARVGVLVPPSAREEFLAVASRLRIRWRRMRRAPLFHKRLPLHRVEQDQAYERRHYCGVASLVVAPICGRIPSAERRAAQALR